MMLWLSGNGESKVEKHIAISNENLTFNNPQTRGQEACVDKHG